MTPSQTIGPFFSHALAWPDSNLAVPLGTPDAFWLRGKVFDGQRDPVPDALIEGWQPFGRCATDPEGSWSLYTIVAPHLSLSVFARGLLNRLVTRVYLPDRLDETVLSIPEPRRKTLIARP